MQWNPDQIDLFKALYIAEIPATQIASQFGIDKKTVFRQASKYGFKRPQSKPVAQYKPLVIEYAPKIRVKNTVDLKEHHCRFIIGDVKISYGYCGRKVYKGSWCKECFDKIRDKDKNKSFQRGSL